MYITTLRPRCTIPHNFYITGQSRKEHWTFLEVGSFIRSIERGLKLITGQKGPAVYCSICMRCEFLRVLWLVWPTPVGYTLQYMPDLGSWWSPENFEWSYFSVGQIEKKLPIFIPGPKRAKMRDSHAKCVSLGGSEGLWRESWSKRVPWKILWPEVLCLTLTNINNGPEGTEPITLSHWLAVDTG